MASPSTPGICANTAGSLCQKLASDTCGRCFLVQVLSSFFHSLLLLSSTKTVSTVQYCSKECQKSHWPSHKNDCNSPLMKETWRPSRDTERRQPAFIGDGPGYFAAMPWNVVYGQNKYLWGNVPALDLVNLAQNEGVNIPSSLHLLFAGRS